MTGMAHMVSIAEKNVQVVEQEMTENGWALSSQTNWDRPNVNMCTARGLGHSSNICGRSWKQGKKNCPTNEER